MEGRDHDSRISWEGIICNHRPSYLYYCFWCVSCVPSIQEWLFSDIINSVIPVLTLVSEHKILGLFHGLHTKDGSTDWGSQDMMHLDGWIKSTVILNWKESWTRKSSGSHGCNGGKGSKLVSIVRVVQ